MGTPCITIFSWIIQVKQMYKFFIAATSYYNFYNHIFSKYLLLVLQFPRCTSQTFFLYLIFFHYFQLIQKWACSSFQLQKYFCQHWMETQFRVEKVISWGIFEVKQHSFLQKSTKKFFEYIHTCTEYLNLVLSTQNILPCVCIEPI